MSFPPNPSQHFEPTKDLGVSISQTQRTSVSISQLRADMSGRVIGPGDSVYDAARTVFYGGFDRRPFAIVRAADAVDVSRVVTLAAEADLELAVRSGGHSLAGHGVSDGGIVVDLTEMTALDIDPKGRTAWAQAGLTTGEYTAAAQAHGLATGFGDTGSVGIGGITLGGGIGFLSRKHGLTIDSLLAADMVTADGEARRVDAENHPDLFWAIRGGGGNFGVVTRFHYRLHEVGTVVGGVLILPATPDNILSFVAAAESAPEELTTIANVMKAPPMPFLPEDLVGRLVIFGMMVHVGSVEAGERAIAPFRELAEPIADMVRPMRYPEIFMEEEGRRSSTHSPRRAPCSSTNSTVPPPKRSSVSWKHPPRRWRWRRSACLAERWHGCRSRPPLSPTANGGSWSTSPPFTRAPTPLVSTGSGRTA